METAANLVLTNPLHMEILNQMKVVACGYPVFRESETLITEKLKQAILDADRYPPRRGTTEKLTVQYFSKASPGWAQIKVIFQSCFVLMESKKEHAREVMWSDPATLLEKYPQFQGVSDEELGLLLRFRNMTKVALFLIPGERNKQTIIDIAAALEGSMLTYITGSGESAATARRVAIFRQESGVVKEVRPEPRIRVPKESRPAEDSNPVAGKRKASSAPVANKSAKLTLLPAEEEHAVRRNVEKSAGTPFADAMTSPLLALARVMATLPTIAHAQTQERTEASLPIPSELIREVSSDLLSGDAFADDNSFSRYVVSGDVALNDSYSTGQGPPAFQRATSDGSLSMFTFSDVSALGAG